MSTSARRLALVVATAVTSWTCAGWASQAAASHPGDITPIYWGALVRSTQYGLPEPPQDMRGIATFESHAGKGAAVVHFGDSWVRNGAYVPFPRQNHENVRLHGRIPLFSWSTRVSGPSNAPPDLSNAAVASGAHDAYIRHFAMDARDWGRPMFLRLDWEMNGWWYLWAEGRAGTSSQIVNGNRAGDYVRMWRHVHDIFEEVGATNVSWVWCINQMSRTYAGSHPSLEQIYPGDAYVDWTAVDIHNRYDGWESFETALTGSGTTWLLNTYRETLRVAPTKPIMLAELASKEDTADPNRKAAWLTDALREQLPHRFPSIKAALYFN